MRIREVAGIFGARTVASPAVDELLGAGFDRGDINTLAPSEHLRGRIGDTPVPAVDLADTPGAPQQEFVAPEDTAGIFALCAAVVGCIGAMIGALTVAGWGGATAWTIIAAVIGAAAGCGLGVLIARYLGCRWRHSSITPAGTDGLVLWVRVLTAYREQEALRILMDRGADDIHVHEIEKRLDDLPLSSLRTNP
jgi:uncharacterized membrane protein YeaQ/YmgE (transglycosylase-associated protein family)